MTGRRKSLILSIIGSLLLSGVALATNLDNAASTGVVASSSFVRPFDPHRDRMVAETTTTTTTTVAALPPTVPVATSVARSGGYQAAAVVTTPTTAVKTPEEAPPPPPETVSNPEPAGDDCMGWLSYVQMRGLPVDTFCGDADNPGIIWCESRGKPTAQNGQHAGLTQLARKYHEWRAIELGYAWSDMHDGSANLHVASHLYNEQGTSPWNPSKFCWG